MVNQARPLSEPYLLFLQGIIRSEIAGGRLQSWSLAGELSAEMRIAMLPITPRYRGINNTGQRDGDICHEASSD